MNNVFKRVTIMIVLIFAQSMLVQASDFDDFFNNSGINEEFTGLQENRKIFHDDNSKGDVNRLLKAMGEDPEKLTERQGRFLAALTRQWYWIDDPLTKSIGEKCDESGNNCVPQYQQAPTAAEIQEKQKAQLQLLYEYYTLTFPSNAELIKVLAADIKALIEKRDGTKNSNLRKHFDNLLFVARKAEKAFQTAPINKKMNQLLQDFIPSKSNSITVLDALKDARSQLDFALESHDELSVNAYRKIISQLEVIQKEILVLMKNEDASYALKKAQDKLLMLEKNQKNFGGKSFDEQIKLYQAIVASLKTEVDREAVEQKKFLDEKVSIDHFVVQALKNAADSPRQAYINQQEKISILELELHRLRNLHSHLNKKEIQNKEAIIAFEHKVLHALHGKVQEAEATDSRENKKVNQKVDALLIKFNSNISKAFSEAVKSVGKHTESESVKIENIKQKQNINAKLSEDEKIVMQLYEKQQEERMKDPVNVAIKKLHTAKPADVPQALEEVVGAILGKSGMTIDKLDIAIRQDLAVMLKSTSDGLISIMENKSLPESVKQQKKQALMKEMLKDSSILIGSAVTGASQAALQTRDPRTIATDIALNKFIDTLVPQQPTPEFNFSTFDM